MAREPQTASVGADQAAAGEKKRRKGGPRKPGVKYLLARVLDGQGNPVPGGSVQVITETKSIDQFVEAQSQNPGAVLLKIGGGQVAKTGNGAPQG